MTLDPAIQALLTARGTDPATVDEVVFHWRRADAERDEVQVLGARLSPAAQEVTLEVVARGNA
jgi:hypothetical protein